MCLTSPPYYSLRSYADLPPLVWGQACCDHEHAWGATETSTMRQRNGAVGGLHEGRATNKLASNVVLNPGTGQACQHVHEWDDPLPAWKPGQVAQTKWLTVPAVAEGQRASAGQLCRGCGAWRGHLGLEPTVELYVEHLVECFREVRRVLRDDGTLWLNLGVTYAGSGKGPTGHNGIGNQEERQGFESAYVSERGNLVRGGRKNKTDAQPGYKAKDRINVPGLVEEALRLDGWYVRTAIPWLKRNGMPESVLDRPVNAVEYVLQLTKSPVYYYDPDAIRLPHADDWHARASTWRNGKAKQQQRGDTYHAFKDAKPFENPPNPEGRGRRNSDWFFESWQGLLLDDDDEPMAVVVNAAGLKAAHYAAMPVKLVMPFVKASTSEKGCCPECGAPWERVVERVSHTTPVRQRNGRVGHTGQPAQQSGWFWTPAEAVERGWQPTCDHAHPNPVPCTVLDPFAGAATTLLAADRLGRNGIGCELSDTYNETVASKRLVGDSPLFAQLEML